MTHLLKLRVGSIMKWVFSNSAANRITGSVPVIIQHPRFYGRRNGVVDSENGDLNRKIGTGKDENVKKRADAGRMALAKAALQEYLYSTRNMHYLDAENVSKNSPIFVKNLLKKIEDKEDVGRALRLLFRYHLINEFEPFLESLGLKPSEYGPLLERGMTFLSDDALLMENYHVLYNYGITPKKIGRIFLGAREVFRYDYGVLQSKLLAYEKLGLTQSTVAMVIVSSPGIFIGDVDEDFVKVLEELKRLGIEFCSMEGNFLESSYDWGLMLELLRLFGRIVRSEEKLGELISRRPGLLFDGSGKWTLSLIGFLLKFGCTMNEMHSLFRQFPQIHVQKFVSNLKRSFMFLHSIDMDVKDIQNIIRSHPHVLGSCHLKKPSHLLGELKASKQRVCTYVKENPHEMKNWVFGSKPEPLPETEKEKLAEIEKAKFLSDMRIDEDSCNKKGVYKKITCKDLQERFDTIVQAGLDPEDVAGMIRGYPELLQRSKDGIQKKIDYLVNNLGYPVSTLLTFPMYLRLSTQRVKLRTSMYNWLKEEGAVNATLSASTLLGASDKCFVKWYVSHHPRGLEVWEDMKKQIYLE